MSDIDSANDFRQKGREEYNKKNYKQAIEYFKKACELNPDDELNNYWCGLAYYKNDDYEKAIEKLEKACILNPDDYLNFHWCGLAYYRKGDDYEKAIEKLEIACTLNPDSDGNFYWCGRAYFESKDYKEAIEKLEIACELNDSDDNIFYWCGRAYYKNGKYDKAIEKLKRACELNDSDYKNFHWCGLAYYKNGDYDEAIEKLERACELNDSDDNNFYWCGRAYYLKEDYEKAVEKFDKSVELCSDKDIYFVYEKRGDAKKELGDNRGAKEDYELALENATKNNDENQAEIIRKKINDLDIIILENNYNEESVEHIDLKNQVSRFGIDFGTTNSALISITGSENSPILNKYGDAGIPVPSLVAIKNDGTNILTGNKVKQAMQKDENFWQEYRYFPSIKSVIEKDDKYEINGKIYTPVDIAAELLKKLKNAVETNGDNLDEAVVAIPVGFTAKEKEKLREAAQKAGFTITMFISEPTAACCANYKNLKPYGSNIAVFDWGGGTLDVSVIEIKDNKIRELATQGMKYAGNDIDKKLARKIHKRFSEQINKNISFEQLDEKTKAMLLSRCEQAKCNISNSADELLTISINDYFGSPVRTQISYDEFKELIEDDIEKALDCLETAIKHSGIDADYILCVGGSSKLRPLRDALEKKYNISENQDKVQVSFPAEPMWDIAQGAAIIATRPGKFALSKPIGLILSDDDFCLLLNAGQKIPTVNGSINLRMVESGDSAKIIVADAKYKKDRSIDEYYTIPCRAFDDAILKLTYCVDPNFGFRIKIESNKSKINKVGIIDKVNVYYEVEDNPENQQEYEQDKLEN